MRTNRRTFLGQSSVVTLGAMPALACRGASTAALPKSNRDGKVLVVIQMSGGNDGINTVVPYSDEGYAKHRNTLRLPVDRLIKLDDSAALHPSMRSAADLFEDGRLAIVQGVGYPNPSRSHDTSMAVWHSAEIGDENTLRPHGWLGKAMDSRRAQAGADVSNAPDMVLLGDESQPLAIQSRRSIAVALSNLTDLRLRGPRWEAAEQGTRNSASNSLENFVGQTMQNAMATASALEQTIEQSHRGGVVYPSTQLGQRMQVISTLLKCGFQTPVYYAIQSGYDTHAAQMPTHAFLLREFSDAIQAFLKDLDSSGLADQVCVLGFSEFGRRVTENGSAGTDHGTAGPVFIAGNQVRPGLVGAQPKLLDLDGGDLRMGIDFRDVYQGITANWLGVNQDRASEDSQHSLKIFKGSLS
ncbi:DUF1501 domain-containing protein [Aureliella helgolandensis]|uniref:DUF1501 domain-containing protein n=1 Tax=Aureliella helgolandensis TaxID=2527968 RepID=A0A518G1T7_9BACT|nr:DUF1501 domain-containing protein [Aureliella helgolandensis]QDV22571.1 hypothetical protein Q31a_08570 [Aureliella helgolandensis]